MPAALPPGPRQPALVQTLRWWTRYVPFVEECRRRYGRRFTLQLIIAPGFVIIADPDEAKEVFTAPPDVLHPGAGAARVLEPLVGRTSVILLDEQAHLEQRRLMLPAFHGERIQQLAGLVEEVAERSVASWPHGEPVALHPRLQRLTLDIILRAVFGVEGGERLEALQTRLTAILELGSGPGVAVPAFQRQGFGLTPWARFTRVRAEADELLYALIGERRRDGVERDDVLTVLLGARHEDGSPMADDEIRDELMTLLVAGHETTASQLAWAFERLARTPAVLRRLEEEIDRGDDDAYLTATVQETLRRRPVLPNAAPRLVMREVEIGGWRYPEGASLAPGTYLIHHDPAIYPDPYAFRPERFLDSPPGTYTWIPFGGGRRRCLGASFAQLEMKAVLRAVVGRHDLAAGIDGPALTRRRSITLSPRDGARTVLREREPATLAAA